MANIQVKDVFGNIVNIKASGTGTANDPYVPEQDINLKNTTLPLPNGASTETTVSSIKTLSEVSLGQKGHILATNTNPQTGSWAAIQVIEPATFSALTCASTTEPAINVELPTGFILYGSITAFTLGSGKVIAYKR
ncbi:hypothetical protein AMR41_29460 [Hapalosiphon sp. MRB220]|nr:hypothetical protein AMR41_29460 [Hapalosiphon sp. MRB220]